MFNKVIHGGKMPIEITWTLKIANTKDGMKMVKVAHTGAVTDNDLEDIDTLIKKYADTGVIEEMQKRPESFLWLRARAIDADVPNENGDYFSEDQLLAEVDAGKRGKIAAFKTFEGVPIYTNHKNDDIEQAKGKVVFAEWDNKQKCVYCTFFIDSEAYPQLARGIREGYIKDVSMGCQVDHSRCSICDNKALTEKDYCSHVKELKGRKFTGVVDKGPNKGKKVVDSHVFEKNYEVKFIELSCVSDGAFENCEIEEVLPAERMIKSQTEAITKEAESIEKRVLEAINHGDVESEDVKTLLINSVNLANDAKKLANIQQIKLTKESQIFPSNPRDLSSPADTINPLTNTPDTLDIAPVAGEATPPPAQDAPLNNPTDPTASGEGIGVNTLDALKDVIRNINTVIVTLLGTKGINLEHVRDLSKSVADIQDTIEDMIDSGSIDVSGSIPIAGNQMGASPAAPEAGGAPPPPPQGAPNYSTPQEGVGLQVGASSNESKMTKGLTKLKENLQKFSNLANKHPQNKEEGGIMSDFKKLASVLREQKVSSKNERYEQERDGYKIALASNGQITAYYKNTEVDWKPEISDELVEKIDNGLISDATSDLLAQFSSVFSEGKRIRRVASVDAETPESGTEVRFQDQGATWPIGRLGNPGYPMEQYLEKARKGEGSNRENDLGEVRMGIDERVKEQQLEDRKVGEGLLGRSGVDERVKEQQLADVREGADVNQEENRLAPKRASVDAAKVVASINEALANAVVESAASPEEVVESAVKMASSNNLINIVAEYASDEHKKVRDSLRKRAKFYGEIKLASTDQLNVDSFVIGSLADVVSSNVSANDLSYGLSELAHQNIERYAGVIGQIAKDKIEKAGGVSTISCVEEDASQRLEMRKQFIKAMVSNDDSAPEYTRQSVMHVVSAMAKTIVDNEVSSEEVLQVLASNDKDELFATIELAKESEAISARKRVASRKNFALKTASNGSDLLSDVVGNIADTILASGISTKESVDTINLLITKKASTKLALETAVRKLNKEAATVNDRSEREFTVNFNLSECGCDKNDPDVESKIREYIVQLFEGRGYQLSDPQTLSFTNLDIREDGTVCGTIRSTVTRSFKAEGGGSEAPDMMGAMAAAPEVIVSDRMIEARRDSREALVKAAQMMGGDMGANPGLAGGAGGDPAAAATGADPGIAAITGGGEPGSSDEMGDDKSPEESIPTPGQIAPPGSICPGCGSTDVDLTEGHGKCNDCSVEFNVLFQIQITNPELLSGGETTGGEDLEMDEDLGMDMPEEGVAPDAGGQAPPAGGGMPGAGAGAPAGAVPQAPMASSSLLRIIEAAASNPQLVRISWISEPDVFLKTSSAAKNDLPQVPHGAPGCVCPSCGTTEQITKMAGKSKTNMYCESCGLVGVIDVAMTKNNQLMNSITWVI